MTETPEDRLLVVADGVAEELRRLGVETAVIGAIALAVHGYPRSTLDIDLATSKEPSFLDDLSARLRGNGHTAVVRHPDAEDPLGGVLDLPVEGGLRVQVVNFLNPCGVGGAWQLAREAIEAAEAGLLEGSSLRVVRPAHLLALKLYAGGPKSRNDVVELLSRRPGLLGEAHEVSGRYGLEGSLESIARELGLR